MVVTFGVLVMTQGSLVFASVTTLRVWGSVCLCVKLRLLVLLHEGLVLGLALVVLAYWIAVVLYTVVHACCLEG